MQDIFDSLREGAIRVQHAFCEEFERGAVLRAAGHAGKALDRSEPLRI